MEIEGILTKSRIGHLGKSLLSLAARPYFTLPIIAIVILLFITDFAVHMTTGDSITTSRVALAGDVFSDVGLIGQRFKPAFYSPMWSTDYLRFYTHFPALPYYYGWVIAEISPWPWPTLVFGYIAVAAGTISGWVYAASKLFSRTFGWLVGLTILALAPTFALLPYNAKSWADLCLALTVVVTVRIITKPLGEVVISTRQWGMLSVFAFGVALSSYEYIPAVVLVTVGLVFTVVASQPTGSARERLHLSFAVSARVAVPVVIGILAALAFHMATNLWALGSVDALLDDMRKAAAIRTDGGSFSIMFPSVGAFVIWMDDKIYALYWISWIWVALITISAIRVGQVARDRRLLSLGVLLPSLWIAFLTFNMIMRQWASVHFNTIGARHFIVPVAFAFATGVYTVVRGVQTREIRRFQRPVASLLVVAVLLVTGLGISRNVQATTTFVAKADNLPMTDLVDDLRAILVEVVDMDGVHVLTDDTGLARASFLHLPRRYFDLESPLAEGFEVEEWEHIATTAGRDEGCGEASPCVLVLTERIADQAFRDSVCQGSKCHFYDRWTMVRIEEIG